MNKTKKLIALVLALVLVCAGSVFATVAYLTAEKSVTNTFTVGNIDISLDETKVYPDGTPVEPEERVEENNYHLVPGSSYVKDPTLTIDAESEEAYVRMLVQVNALGELMEAIPQDKYPEFYADKLFLLEKLVTGYDASVWKYVGFDDDTNIYEFRYYKTTVTDGSNDLVLEPLFETIEIPGFITEEGIQGLENVEIKVIGQAIQAANFAADGEKTAEDAAWAAFGEQNPAA